MIIRILGQLHAITPPKLMIQTSGGLGYEVLVPLTVLEHLPSIGQVIDLHTHLVIKEDAHTLYGFHDLAQKNMFLALTKISGVGGKIALAVLSGLSLTRLQTAIECADIQLLSSIPGIGKKMAERMVLEMTGQLSKFKASQHQISNKSASENYDLTIMHDALLALVSLGYSEKQAELTLKKVQELHTDPLKALSIHEVIKLALKFLA